MDAGEPPEVDQPEAASTPPTKPKRKGIGCLSAVGVAVLAFIVIGLIGLALPQPTSNTTEPAATTAEPHETTASGDADAKPQNAKHKAMDVERRADPQLRKFYVSLDQWWDNKNPAVPRLGDCADEPDADDPWLACFHLQESIIASDWPSARRGEIDSARVIAGCFQSGCKGAVIPDEKRACAWRLAVFASGGDEVQESDAQFMRDACNSLSPDGLIIAKGWGLKLAMDLPTLHRGPATHPAASPNRRGAVWFTVKLTIKLSPSSALSHRARFPRKPLFAIVI